MFEHPETIQSQTLLRQMAMYAIPFFCVASIVGWAVPSKSELAQEASVNFLMENLSKQMFVMLCYWSIVFTRLHVLMIKPDAANPAKWLLWLGLRPAEVAFNTGAANVGGFLGMSLVIYASWGKGQETMANDLMAGVAVNLILLFLLAFEIRYFCTGSFLQRPNLPLGLQIFFVRLKPYFRELLIFIGRILIKIPIVNRFLYLCTLLLKRAQESHPVQRVWQRLQNRHPSHLVLHLFAEAVAFYAAYKVFTDFILFGWGIVV